MKLEFDVTMTAGVLYDYMLRHTYTSSSGLLGGAAGALLIIASLTVRGGTLYLIAGIVILLYLPWTLRLRSRRQMMTNAAFREPLHYSLDDSGITVSQRDLSETVSWETMNKAVSTGKSVIVYTSAVNAFIFPRKDMGELTPRVVEQISIHMPAKRVHIRY